ncbi:MAG: alpha/beta hydrolase [Candidatus Lokiarchaeota archaeon]|nr:alpha/beta hydrolase [Candidatus Lokiarchaeota archaeon]
MLLEFEIPPKIILEKKDLKINDIILKYFESGIGRENLIFIHGFTGSIDEWHFQITEFQKYYKIFCFNMRGHGGSELGTEVSFEILTQDLKNFIDILKIKDPIIIGHSLGGIICLNYAIRYPFNLKKLVIVDGLPFFKQNMPLELVERFSEKEILDFFSHQLTLSKQKIPVNKLEFYEKLKAWSIDRREKAINGRMLKKYFEALRAFDLTQQLKEIKIPTLVVFGEEDRILNSQVVESYKKIKNCQFITFKECGHSPPREYIKEFNDLLHKFLKRI